MRRGWSLLPSGSLVKALRWIQGLLPSPPAAPWSWLRASRGVGWKARCPAAGWPWGGCCPPQPWAITWPQITKNSGVSTFANLMGYSGGLGEVVRIQSAWLTWCCPPVLMQQVGAEEGLGGPKATDPPLAPQLLLPRHHPRACFPLPWWREDPGRRPPPAGSQQPAARVHSAELPAKHCLP